MTNKEVQVYFKGKSYYFKDKETALKNVKIWTLQNENKIFSADIVEQNGSVTHVWRGKVVTFEKC